MSLAYDPDAIDAEDGDDYGSSFEGYVPSKDAVVWLVDAAKEMIQTTTKLEDEEVSCLHGTIRIVHEYLREKIITSPSDETALVFYNSGKSEDPYDYVYTHLKLDSPDAARIRSVQQLSEGDTFEEQVGTAEGGDAASNLKMGLRAATYLLPRGNIRTTCKIYVLTVNQDPTAGTAGRETYRAQLRQQFQDLADINVMVELLPLLPGFQLAPFWRAMLVANGQDPDAVEQPSTDFELSSLLDHVRTVARSRRSLGALRWTLAPDLEIGLQVHSVVQPATKGGTGHLRAVDHAPLRPETAYICQDTGAILRLDADIQKYTCAPKQGCFPPVILLSSERRALKGSMPPGLHLLGFKPAAALQPFHQLTHSYYLRPSDRDFHGSTTLYYALYGAMQLENSIAICSFVRNKSSEPRLVALLPFPISLADSESTADAVIPGAPAGLHMVPLPFADDLRAPETDPDLADRALQATATDEMVDAAVDMVQGLKLRPEDHPSHLPNPALQRWYEVLQALALQEEVPPLAEFQDDTVPDPEGFSSKQHLITAFEQATGLDKAAAAAAAGSKKRGRPLTEGVDASGAVNVRQMAETGKLDTLRVVDLQEYLRRHKQKASGNKADLLQRVRDHLGLA